MDTQLLRDRHVSKLAGCVPALVGEWRKRHTPLDSRSWSVGLALGFAVRQRAIKDGASPKGAASAWAVVESCDLQKVRDAISKGFQYLRIWGDACDTKLIDAATAFDLEQLKRAAAGRVRFAVLDMKVLLDELDALTASKPREKPCDSLPSSKSQRD